MALSGGRAPLGEGRLAERQPETCSDFAGNVLSTESHHLKISLRLGGGGSFTSLEMLVTESRICSKASPLAPSRREKENAAFGQVPNMGPSRGAREAVLKRLDPGALGEGLKGRGRGEGRSHPPQPLLNPDWLMVRQPGNVSGISVSAFGPNCWWVAVPVFLLGRGRLVFAEQLKDTAQDIIYGP